MLAFLISEMDRSFKTAAEYWSHRAAFFLMHEKKTQQEFLSLKVNIKKGLLWRCWELTPKEGSSGSRKPQENNFWRVQVSPGQKSLSAEWDVTLRERSLI